MGQILKYKQNTKFLGVCLNTKLNWRLHIENLITKARKRLNLLDIVSSQPWCKDTKTLQSIDSKAVKLAIGVPVHTNTIKTYTEAGMISLSEQHKLAVSEYVIRSLSVTNSVTEEIFIDSNRDYSKRSQNIPSIPPIQNYTNALISDCKGPS